VVEDQQSWVAKHQLGDAAGIAAAEVVAARVVAAAVAAAGEPVLPVENQTPKTPEESAGKLHSLLSLCLWSLHC
jgi:hypothetical protein